MHVKPPPPNRRKELLGIGLWLVLAAVGIYVWTGPLGPAPEPDFSALEKTSPPPSSPLISRDHSLMKSASRDEALEKPHTRAADDPNRFPLEKTPPALTPAEEALVQEKFSTALQSLYEVEVKNARKLKEADMDFGDRSHVIFIHVAAPTLEQIEPVLAAVTKAGKEFPPGSAAAMAFREKADAFVKELQIRPQKLVQRSIHPKTGAIDDTVIQLSADAKFTVNEGSISYEGKSIGGFDMTQSSDHLFRQPLPEAK